MWRALALTLGLAGCSHQLPQPPKVVTVTVDRYVQVPDALTQPCPVYEPSEQTVGEAKRLALLRRESLLQCNSQLEKIRQLGDKATSGTK